MADFEDTAYGPALVGATSRATVEVESSVEVGWSTLLTCAIVDLTIGEDDSPLLHRRGRYSTTPQDAS